MPSRCRARPTWVSQLIRVGARGRGVRGPARAIGVERHGEPVLLEDSAQRGHDGHHALAAGDELAVEDLLGGVIDHGDQRLLAGGVQRQPGMDAAVEMEQFAATGAAPGGADAARADGRWPPAPPAAAGL